MPKKISSLEQLQKEADDENDADFFILLVGNLRNSKRIIWDEEDGRFFILNLIDDTVQELTEEQIMDRDYTHVGFAMGRGGFTLLLQKFRRLQIQGGQGEAVFITCEPWPTQEMRPPRLSRRASGP